VYFEANLKPGDDINELAKKLSGEQDPGGRIKQEIEKSARESQPDFKFSEDVEPWLGDRAGVFVPKITMGDETPVGIVLPTKDADKAKEAIEKTIRTPDKGEDKPQIAERTYKDTKYIVDTSEDNGVAIVDDSAVVGSDSAIKGAIDAADGDSLADNAEYEKARDAVEGDGVGFAYVRLSQVFSGLGPQGAAARQALKGFGDTIAIGLDGDASSITAESASLGVTGEPGPSGAGEVFADLPAESWLAAGGADVGGRIEQAIEQFSQLGALSGQDPEQLLDQLEAQLGIDPRRDLAAWMGDAAFFAVGDTPAEIGGGLVAKTKDAAATRRSIPRIARFLERVGQVQSKPLRQSGVDTGVTLTSPQVPLPIHMVLTDDERFIVAVTDRALEQALKPTAALGDSQAFKDAAGKLGDGLEPQVFLNFAPVAAFVDATGAASGNAGAEQARKALDRLTTLVAGGKRDGDTARGKVVIGVK
jgi:hypothetical protein